MVSKSPPHPTDVPTPALDLLAGRTVAVPAGSGAPGEVKKYVGSRYNGSLNTVLVGRKTTIYQRGQEARTFVSRLANPVPPEALVLRDRKTAGGSGDAAPAGRRVFIHDIKRRPPVLRRPNVTAAKALQLDEKIIDLMAQALLVEVPAVLKRHPKSSSAPLFVRREGLGLHFGVPDHVISQCFERLNKRGLLSAETNRPAHDSTRDPWGGTDSAWTGSIRYIHHDKLAELVATRDPVIRSKASPASTASPASSMPAQTSKKTRKAAKP